MQTERIGTASENLIIRAKINGKIMAIDLASNEKNAYRDMEYKVEYLGSGLYYSYGNTKATDKKVTHFWKWREVEKSGENIEISAPAANVVLDDNAVREALSTILRVGANMVMTGISGDISEWGLPKSTPLKAKRKIVEEADKRNDVNRRRAIELKSAYDIISKRFR